MRRLTKTFVENRWFRRVSPANFVEIPKHETNEGPSIDQQVREWVDETGHVIIHPGQIGMHQTWHGDKEDPYQLKCITCGLTVLYQEVSHGGQPIQRTDPISIDPGAGTVQPGTFDPRPWGDHGSPVDGAGSP